MTWVRLPLGQLLSFEYGKALRASDRDSEGEFEVAGSNGPDGKHSQPLVAGPGIVVGRKGSAGKVVWYEMGFWPIDTTYYVRPNCDLELRWVFYLLQNLDLARLATSTGVPGLNRNDVYSLEVPYPPLSEQRRIVEILDQADSLRRLRAEADAKAEHILSALFITLFGDPATNPKGWRSTTLGAVALDFRYGTSTRCEPRPHGLPVLRIPNLVQGTVDWSDLKYAELDDAETRRLLLRIGDLLFVRTNGNPDYVGRCAVFDSDADALFASYLIRVRVDQVQVDSWYLAAFLQTPMGRQAMSPSIRTTAGQSNINIEGLKQIPILVPPKAEQLRFREYWNRMQEINNKALASRDTLDAVFQGLLRAAFSGNLTASWREAHLEELRKEMEQQARALSTQPLLETLV